MALSAHVSSERPHVYGPHPITAHETQASAQARIATSAPKNTYGKYKNSLLPLTGIQFLHSNALDAANDKDRLAASNAIVPATDQFLSDADDSPLSDAEPAAGERYSRAISPRPGRVSVLDIDKPTTRPHRLEAGDVSGDCSSSEEERTASHSPKGVGSKPGWRRSRHAAPSAQKKGKRKLVGVLRGHLPLKELVLVSDLNEQECFGKLPKKDRGTLARDPISSSAQQILDLVGSEDLNSTPAKRKANIPLSAIRKRLRTPSTGYKSLKALRKKYHASQITPTGSQLQRVVGDGFDQSELTPIPRSQYATKRARKYCEPLLADMQALSLASGPLPDVVFTSSSQLDLENNQSSYNYSAETFDKPAMTTAISYGNHRSSVRRVGFENFVDHNVSAQLASVSAPRRERSVSLECGSDDGDEGDDEGDDDDDDEEEADTYVDEDELAPEEDAAALSEDDHGMSDLSPEASPKRNGYGRNGSHLFRATSTSERRVPSGYLPGSHRRCTQTEELLLNEVNESIDDDYHIDDMLLDNQDGFNEDTISQTTDGSVKIVEAPHLDKRNRSDIEQAPSRQSTPKQTNVTSTRTRSILKNNTPHVSSDSNRPESTAANTRRNSIVAVEQSRYFSTAKVQLDSSLEKPAVIRKKSGSRFCAPIEVPYSDYMVPETSSPRKVSYTDASQLHTLKRTRGAVWTSSAAPVPETELRSLTRNVSRNNGTLSQSVRRGSSIPFQNPAIGR